MPSQQRAAQLVTLRPRRSPSCWQSLRSQVCCFEASNERSEEHSADVTSRDETAQIATSHTYRYRKCDTSVLRGMRVLRNNGAVSDSDRRSIRKLPPQHVPAMNPGSPRLLENCRPRRCHLEPNPTSQCCESLRIRCCVERDRIGCPSPAYRSCKSRWNRS